MKPAYTYRAELIRVVDGDTVRLKIDLGFFIEVHESFRLYGIDTPEIRGKTRKEGLKAKKHVEDRFAEAKQNDRDITACVHKKGKYGRWLAEIFFDDDSLNEELVEKGLAVEY